jgi:hypothetical protein
MHSIVKPSELAGREIFVSFKDPDVLAPNQQGPSSPLDRAWKRAGVALWPNLTVPFPLPAFRRLDHSPLSGRARSSLDLVLDLCMAGSFDTKCTLKISVWMAEGHFASNAFVAALFVSRSLASIKTNLA